MSRPIGHQSRSEGGSRNVRSRSDLPGIPKITAKDPTLRAETIIAGREGRF